MCDALISEQNIFETSLAEAGINWMKDDSNCRNVANDNKTDLVLLLR